MVKEKRVELNAFVLMNTYLHFIWQALPGHSPQSIQASFMKFTAHQMKQDSTSRFIFYTPFSKKCINSVFKQENK